MNLVEAHRSGRRFKRQDEEDFYELADMADAHGDISLEDAVAEDYILEPVAKLLTRDDVSRAFQEAYFDGGFEYVTRKEALLKILFKETAGTCPSEKK